MDILLSGMTWWHWLALALVLFGIEMVTGTFDLLMASAGAVMTAVFAALAPAGIAGWQGQIIVFISLAIVLILVSRLAFPSLRRAATEHPTLNRRMDQLVGQACEATQDFGGSSGQVRIGDTVWRATAREPADTIRAGDRLVVDAFQGSLVIVRKP